MKKPWDALVNALGKKIVVLMDFCKEINSETMDFIFSHQHYLDLLEYFQKHFNISSNIPCEVELFFLQDFLNNDRSDHQHEELIDGFQFLAAHCRDERTIIPSTNILLRNLSEDRNRIIHAANFYRLLEGKLKHTYNLDKIQPHHLFSILSERDSGPEKLGRIGNLILMIEACFPSSIQIEGDKGNFARMYFQQANTIVDQFPKERDKEVITIFAKICVATVKNDSVILDTLYHSNLLYKFHCLCNSDDFFTLSQKILAALTHFKPGSFPPYKIIPELMGNPDDALELVSAINLLNNRKDINRYDCEILLEVLTIKRTSARRTAECLYVLLGLSFAAAFGNERRQYDSYWVGDRYVTNRKTDPTQIQETDFVIKIASFENGVAVAQALLQFDKDITPSIPKDITEKIRTMLLQDANLPRASYIVETLIHLKDAHCFGNAELLNCLFVHMKNIDERTTAKVKQLFAARELTFGAFQRVFAEPEPKSNNVVQLGIYGQPNSLKSAPMTDNDIEIEVVFH